MTDTKRVLMVDDLPRTVKILRKRINEIDGVSVDPPIRTIDEGVEALRTKQYDLLITDLYLPGKSFYLESLAEKYGINLSRFNQGQVLGRLALELKISFIYYTSELNFYNGDESNVEMLSKSISIDEVIKAVMKGLKLEG